MATYSSQFVPALLKAQHSQVVTDAMGTDVMGAGRELYAVNLEVLTLIAMTLKIIQDLHSTVVTDAFLQQRLDAALDTGPNGDRSGWQGWILAQVRPEDLARYGATTSDSLAVLQDKIAAWRAAQGAWRGRRLMADWALTLGLQNLRTQVNRVFPDRDKTSDGTIGDTAHQASTSSHNPDDTAGSKPEWNADADSDPEVRAWDMDSDLRTPGVTTQDLVDHLRRLPNLSSVIRYMIYNRKIYRAANGWAAEDYTGSSPHTEHVHFTGAYSQAADQNTTFDYHLEDLVALTPDDIEKIADRTVLKLAGADTLPGDPAKNYTFGGALYDTSQRVIGLQAQATALAAAVKALAAKDTVDEHALAGELATAVAAVLVPKVVEAVPQTTGAMTMEELTVAVTTALKTALRDAFASAS